MVCQKCLKSQSAALVTPEFNKDKSNSSISSATSKVVRNIILSKKKVHLDTKCAICKGRVEGNNNYCLTCAYTKGLCEVCGVKMQDTKSYKFTDVDVKDAKRKAKMKEKTQNLNKELLKEKKLVISDETLLLKRKKKREEPKHEDIKLGNVNTKEENLNISNIEEEDNIDEYDEVIQI